MLYPTELRARTDVVIGKCRALCKHQQRAGANGWESQPFRNSGYGSRTQCWPIATARLARTRWLAPALGNLPGRGADLAFAQTLCSHWRERFDWRAAEARINEEPQVIEQLEGLAIHAVHRRSPRNDATPLMLLHGWPSSFAEFLPVCGALAEPDGDAPAFHVVAPSLPGYGFSQTAPAFRRNGLRCSSAA